MNDRYRKVLCAESMSNLLKKYRGWVLSNPHSLEEMEGVLKWGSYLLAGRVVKSSLVCEIVYSASRLFELFNDCLIQGKIPSFTSHQENQIKVLLCVIESVEVVLEVGAQQLWGDTAKWALLATITFVKLVWRLLLVLRHNARVVTSPALPPLDRANSLRNTKDAGKEQSPSMPMSHSSVSTRLPSSGHLLRSHASAPPPHLRCFLPSPHSTGTKLSARHQVAELLHLFRPASHLSCLYLCGRQSWIPYLLALGMDVSSVHLYRGAVLMDSERSEITRRNRSLLLYLLRSPAYQSVTRARLEDVLQRLAAIAPFTSQICGSVQHYAAYCHRIHSYTWSN